MPILELTTEMLIIVKKVTPLAQLPTELIGAVQYLCSTQVKEVVIRKTFQGRMSPTLMRGMLEMFTCLKKICASYL